MTSVDMTLAESDNILAKFMEWEQDPRHLFWYTKGIDKKFIKPYLSNSGYLYQEAFSTDVNWLMSVVDKIESLEEINLPYSYNYSIGNVNNGIEGNREDSIIVESVSLIIEREEVRVKFYGQGQTVDFVLVSEETKLESIYKAIVLFVKWYNENK